MTKRRLIGYATTDSNGVATLTYTGKGVGEMDIIAETGGEMVSVDIGTSSNYTDTIWNNWNSSAIINRATNYTSITKASSDTAGSWQISNAPFTDNNLKIEFDVYVDSSVQTDTFFQLRNQSYNVLGNITLNNMSLATNTWHHIILRFDGTNCYISNTTNSNTSNRANLTVTKIMFRCDTNTNEVRYKNFFIYRGSSSLVSEPKTIGDMLFYDNATSSSHNDNWEYIETKFTRQTDGTEYSNSNWNVAHIKINDSNNIPFSNGVCVELDVVSRTGASNTTRLTFNDGSNKHIGLNSTGHYKIMVKDSYIKTYLDDTYLESDVAFDTTVSTFQIGLTNTNTASILKFKDFKVYPI